MENFRNCLGCGMLMVNEGHAWCDDCVTDMPLEDFLNMMAQAVSFSKDLEDIREVFEIERNRKFMLSGFVETEAHWEKEFVDSPRVRHEVRRMFGGRRIEMVEWEESFVREDMVPDVKQLIDQGRDHRKTPWLDSGRDDVVVERWGRKVIFSRPYNTMNDRMFRESCVVYGNRLYPVYEKRSVDFNSGTKPEWVSEQVGCDMVDAMTMTECWKRMGIDFMTARKMIKGYYDERAQTWRDGLQNLGRSQGRNFAEYFENLVHELSEVSEEGDLRDHFHDVARRMIGSDDWRLKYHQDAPDAWDMMQFIEESTYLEMEEDMHIIEDDEVILNESGDAEMEYLVSHLGDEISLPPAGEDGFGVRPLYDGSEDLDYDLGFEIESADADEILKIQRRMFKSFNQWTGRWSRPKYWWMTDEQKRKFWDRVNARKSKIFEHSMKLLSADSKEVLAIADSMPNRNQARALIAAYCAGNGFNISGVRYEWDNKPGAEEKFAVWGVFRKGGK